jgi:hypothetical protein
LLVAGLLWEKSTAGWWLISQANRAWECSVLQETLLSSLFSSFLPSSSSNL